WRNLLPCEKTESAESVSGAFGAVVRHAILLIGCQPLGPLENLEFDDLWGKKSHVFQPIPAELDLAKTALDRAPRSPAGLSVRARKRAANPRRLLLLVRSATSHQPSGW